MAGYAGFGDCIEVIASVAEASAVEIVKVLSGITASANEV